METPARIYVASVAAYQVTDATETNPGIIRCEHTVKFLLAVNISEALEGLTDIALNAWKKEDGYSRHSIYLEPLRQGFFVTHLDLEKQGIITLEDHSTEHGKLFFVDDELP